MTDPRRAFLALTLSVSAASAAAIAAAAAPAPSAAALAPAFRGTIISTYPDGRTARLWLHADGSYDAKGRRGDPSSGHWSVKGAKVCLRQARPFPAPFSFCTPFADVRVGGAWKAKAVTGEPITVRLVAGQG